MLRTFTNSSGLGCHGMQMSFYRRLSMRFVSVQALWQAAWLEQSGVGSANAEDLRRSLSAAGAALPDFLAQAAARGWATGDVVIRSARTRIVAE